MAWPRAGSCGNRTHSGLAEFRIPIQLHDLLLGRDLDLDETTCKVAWARYLSRRNDTLGRFPVFQNTTNRHAQAFPGVPEHDGSTCRVTCSGSGTRWSHSSRHLACSGSRRNDMSCHLLGFWISQRAFEAQGLLGVGVLCLGSVSENHNGSLGKDLLLEMLLCRFRFAKEIRVRFQSGNRL